MNNDDTACGELFVMIEKYEDWILSGEIDFMQAEIFWDRLNKLIDECGNDMSSQLRRQVDAIRHTFY